jgi:hypothetical protein
MMASWWALEAHRPPGLADPSIQGRGLIGAQDLYHLHGLLWMQDEMDPIVGSNPYQAGHPIDAITSMDLPIRVQDHREIQGIAIKELSACP